jgi:hypothetical protein
MAEINATLSPIDVTSRKPTQEEIDAYDYEQFKAEQAAPLVNDTELAEYQQFKAEQGNPLLDWLGGFYKNTVAPVYAANTGMIAGVANVLTDPITRDINTPRTQSLADLYSSAAGPVEARTLERLGGVKQQPIADTLGSIQQSAANAAVDPFSYVGGGIKTLGGVGMRAGGQAFLGGAADVGAREGADIEKTFFDTNNGYGAFLGALAAGSVDLPATVAVRLATKPLADIRNKWKDIKVDPNAAEQSMAVGSSKRLLERATQDIEAGDLESIITDFNRISNVIDRRDAPILFSLSDNPTIRAQVTHLAEKDPVFRLKVKNELARVALSIDERADRIFGKQYTALPSNLESINLKNVDDRVKAIDNQLLKLSDPFGSASSKENIGQAITNLVEAKKTAVKQSLSPRYKEVLDDARANNAVLPKEGVADIYNFVKENKLSDIFGKGSVIDKLITTNFAPVPNKAGLIVDSKGNLVNKASSEFKDVSFDNVDSLKKRINELQRSNLSPDAKYKLNLLESKVDEARTLIAGDWNERLKEVDRLYYTKLGIPFGEQGLVDIDAKKYAEQVAPLITSKPTALKQFLDATGNEGVPIARNAIMADMYAKVIKDGEISTAAYKKYMKDNATTISQITGLSDTLTKTLVDDSILKLQRESLNKASNEAKTRLANTFLAKLDGTAPNYKSMAESYLNNPQYFNKIKQDLKQYSPEVSDAVKNNLRREIIAIATDKPEGAFAFINDVRNKRVIDDLFGTTYRQSVNDLAKLSSAVTKANIDRIPDRLDNRALDWVASRVEGMDLPFLTSTIRDRISSNTQKLVRLGSRISTAKLAKATDAQIEELLLDPKGLEKLSNVGKTMSFKIDNPVSKQKVIDAFTDLAPSYFYTVTKEGLAEQPEQKTVREMVNMGYFE